MNEADRLRARIANNVDDIAAVLALCQILMNAGEPIPADLQERALRHHLDNDPTRLDLFFQLANVLMKQERPVPLDVEEQSLRYAMKTNPGRLDLYERFVGVALQNVLPNSAEPPPEADASVLQSARDRLGQALSTADHSSLPSYGIRWGEYAARIRKSISQFSSVAEVVQYAQTKIGFEHRLPAGQALQHYALYEQELAAEFPQFREHLRAFSDPALSAPGTQFALAGRPVSNIVPYLTRIILSCLQTLPPPKIIVELGGGYGAPAKLWLTTPISPATTYIIVDLPESLFFADVFLRSELGTDAVAYIQSPADSASLEQYRVVLCPIHHLAAIETKPVDLIINTGSLQEMTEEWVTFYMQWLDRQNPSYFYSLNYFAQPVGHLAESMNLWSPRPSPLWRAKLLRCNPSLVRMQSERNFMESIYERTTESLAAEDATGRLTVLSERAMTIELLAEYMEVFRRCPDESIAVEILRRVRGELTVAPKESLWLANWLHDAGFKDSEINAFRDVLIRERQAGVEGTV